MHVDENKSPSKTAGRQSSGIGCHHFVITTPLPRNFLTFGTIRDAFLAGQGYGGTRQEQGGVRLGTHFTAVSDCYLACPVKHPFEQVLNAHGVNKIGFGAYWDDLNEERVESFLFNLDSYRETVATDPRKDNWELLARLDAWIEEHVS
jgi:hypothetical protein